MTCGKCGHPAYNHENNQGELGRCYFAGCRCRRFRPPLRGVPGPAARRTPRTAVRRRLAGAPQAPRRAFGQGDRQQHLLVLVEGGQQAGGDAGDLASADDLARRGYGRDGAQGVAGTVELLIRSRRLGRGDSRHAMRTLG